jgi:hypothetical protein
MSPRKNAVDQRQCSGSKKSASTFRGRAVKLREIGHSRAGDKGNASKISVIAYDAKHYPLLLEQSRANG